MTLPTPRDYLRVHRVDACCTACDRVVELDLVRLIVTGHGDTPLIRLPLRCSACGSTEYRVIVSGRSYGVGEGPDAPPGPRHEASRDGTVIEVRHGRDQEVGVGGPDAGLDPRGRPAAEDAASGYRLAACR